MSPRTFTRMSAATLGFAALVLGLLGWPTRADDKEKQDPKAKSVERKPWTTSKVVGSPEPPPKY